MGYNHKYILIAASDFVKVVLKTAHFPNFLCIAKIALDLFPLISLQYASQKFFSFTIFKCFREMKSGILRLSLVYEKFEK
jgi:hypothetical protein